MTAEEIVAQLPVPIGECAIVCPPFAAPPILRVEVIGNISQVLYWQQFDTEAEARALAWEIREIRTLVEALLK